MTDESWHWQEPETAWRGIGIYHVTLVVSSREPLLGNLIIPDNDPKQARVDLKPLGEKIKACVRMIPELHPEIQIIGIRLMPDHVHFILYVRRSMPDSIKNVVRGFWQGAKKQGRLYTLSITPNIIRDNEQRLDPIFSEYPFIRPMSRRGQLDAMMQYIKLNPQRLATKRLRDYMNGCVLAARKGAVMVSPFISPFEKEVLSFLIYEQRPVIYIADNGFGQYYKPSSALFDAVDAGHMLILSPWPYDPLQKHVSRAKCIEMNKIAEEIANVVS